MYLKKAQIKNIRSIVNFEINFENPAGWHVLIGDNGAGKSTIVRSIALVLVGHEQSQALRANWDDWLSQQKEKGEIRLNGELQFHPDHMLLKQRMHYEFEKEFEKIGSFKKNDGTVFFDVESSHSAPPDERWFSSAYGPYRRFGGGNFELQKIFENPSLAKLAAHLSVFSEDVALTEATGWLVGLFNTSTDPNFPEEGLNGLSQLEGIKQLINSERDSESFLPNNTKLESVNSKGVFLRDGKGMTISINQMSDGYRSILSMTFELIRQLVRAYGAEPVFENIKQDDMVIDLPGVVLVDEIDAHLHPTWQTRIGEWFTKYFPKLQFIVTTHSPLVCRAAENGSIWRLAAPGSDNVSGEIVGSDRERLIYGNVLDAFGTEVFGKNVTISEESVKKQEDMVKLSKKKMLDDISPEDNKKLADLKKVFTTDASIEL